MSGSLWHIYQNQTLNKPFYKVTKEISKERHVNKIPAMCFKYRTHDKYLIENSFNTSTSDKYKKDNDKPRQNQIAY